MSTPTLHVDAPRSTPRGVRLRLKSARQSRGVVQGAWWPRSRELTTELPALLSALSSRLGQIDRVIYDEDDWASAPTSVGFGGREVFLGRSHGRSTHAVSMVGERFEGFVLLVVPPFTNPNRAYTTVMAGGPDDVSTADELLGIDAHGVEDRRLALLAHQRWESEGGSLDRMGHPPGAARRLQVPMRRCPVLREYECDASRAIERRLPGRSTVAAVPLPHGTFRLDAVMNPVPINQRSDPSTSATTAGRYPG